MNENVRIDASQSRDQILLTPKRRNNSWDQVLLFYMRFVSILWLIKGISSWLVILGVWSPHEPFYTATLGYQSMVVYFAVTDPIAAIGLWIATPWGGVLWLLAIVTNIILALFFPEAVLGGIFIPYIFSLFVFLYLLFSWFSSRQMEEE